VNKNQAIDPGPAGDDGDAVLDAVLAAADEDMLAAISNGLDLDKGLDQIRKDLHGSAARPQTQAHPEKAQRAVGSTTSQNSSSVVHTESTGAPEAIDVVVIIRQVNELNEAVADLWLRARKAADTAARSQEAAHFAEARAYKAKIAYQAIQREHPRRRAPLLRQQVFALATVVLDGIACYFAARALTGSNDITLVWAGVFMAVLAGGEVALDYYRDRRLRAWRAVAIVLPLLIAILGVLRFWYLAMGQGAVHPATALTEVAVFTAATAGFLLVGYRALRSAETRSAWRARRQARKAWQEARRARVAADQEAAERNRLIDSYLGHIRQTVLKTCEADWQVTMEPAIRLLLSKRLPLEEEDAWRPSKAPRTGG
jgi:hypothetical protein